MARSLNRGLTLIETLVAGAVGLLLLDVLISLFVPSMRMSIRGSVRVEMEQQAVMALERLAADLRGCGRTSLTMTPTGGAGATLSIQRIKDVLSDGTQAWDTNLIVYAWSGPNGTLTRKVVDASRVGVPVTNTRPAPVDLASLPTLAAAPSDQSSVLATGVAQFSVAPGPSNGSSEPVTLTILLLRDAATGEQTPETFTLTRTVALRNDAS